MGGSTNTVLHLLAAAYEAEVDFTMADIDRLSRRVPVLCKVAPSVPDVHLEDVHRAGGIMAILGELDRAGLLNRDVTMVHAESLEHALSRNDIKRARERGDARVLRRRAGRRADAGRVQPGRALRDARRGSRRTASFATPTHAFSKDGGLAVLKGNLAVDGCIVKTAGVDASNLKFEGPAKIFESQDDAVQGILAGEVVAGDVVVIRYEGPRGGPGMQEMLYPTSYLKSKGLGQSLRADHRRPLLRRHLGPLDRPRLAGSRRRRRDRPRRGGRPHRHRHSRPHDPAARLRRGSRAAPRRDGGEGQGRAGSPPSPASAPSRRRCAPMPPSPPARRAGRCGRCRERRLPSRVPPRARPTRGGRDAKAKTRPHRSFHRSRRLRRQRVRLDGGQGKTSFALLDRFAAAGLDAIDTADVYSAWAPGNKGGESETIIGEWMKARGKRNAMTVITKVGSPMGPGKKGLGARYIEEAVEASLKRLQIETIDLYLSHWPDEATPHEETLGAYQRLIAKGKIRWCGASNFNAAQLAAALEASRAHGLPRYEVLQPEYNLYDRAAFDGPLRDLCIAEEIGVITYYSLAKGFLSGKYRSEADLGQSPRGGGVKRLSQPARLAHSRRARRGRGAPRRQAGRGRARLDRSRSPASPRRSPARRRSPSSKA